MKKKLLLTAMAAMGVVGSAQAVHVNPDGLGQVLLYPYFTVQNGFQTAIHIVNTTDKAKAVKVRFLEGKNSSEVLDFNLYLSPEDVWTGAVVFDEANGAKLVSNDTSCIAPSQIPAAGQAFRTFEFASDTNSSDPDRRREGYVEIIEMGELTDSTQITAVTHVNGVPPGCATIAAADNASAVLVDEPTGGLFGSGHVIAVNSGVRTSYDAVALDDFSDVPLWFKSGSTSPSLANVAPFATILDGTTPVNFVPQINRDIDAVSAVLTHATIANEYTIDAGRESKTDWVVTFPTKRFYVNTSTPSPFQRVWSPTALTACHDVSFEYFNREEQGVTPSGGDFSPAPITPGAALCTEVNTLTLYRDGANVDANRLFGAKSTAAALAISGFDAGWMTLTFGVDTLASTYGVLTADNGTTVTGLPVIGFSAMSNVNTVDVQIGGLNVFSSYMGSTTHKGDRQIVELD